MRNRFFACAKTKTQISCAVTAKLISAFVFARRIVQSLLFLNTKFQASSHFLWLYSPVCVGHGRKPRRHVFSERGSNKDLKKLVYLFTTCRSLKKSLKQLLSLNIIHRSFYLEEVRLYLALGPFPLSPTNCPGPLSLLALPAPNLSLSACIPAFPPPPSPCPPIPWPLTVTKIYFRFSPKLRKPPSSPPSPYGQRR